MKAQRQISKASYLKGRKDKRNKENSRTEALVSGVLNAPSTKSIGEPGKIGGRISHKEERSNFSRKTQSSIQIRKFGTEITNTSSVLHEVPHVGIKKSESIKNKFFDNKASYKLEEKVPGDEEEMDVDFEEEKVETFDLNCNVSEDEEMGDVETAVTESAEKLKTIQEMQSIKSERRKAILKELEVCDLLDLRNPQYVAEYATSCF